MYIVIFMKANLPFEIAPEVGYNPKSNMIAKINRGAAKPSPKKCVEIIKAMKKRGVIIGFADLRPDLKDLVGESQP